MSKPSRYCHKCGREYTLKGNPGRSETCDCGSDLHVCLNCVFYDRSVAYQCRERRADPVQDKHVGNFCEYFDFNRGAYTPKSELNSREQSARDALKKLLGD